MSAAEADASERRDWHVLDVREVAERLETDLESGLPDDEAAARLEERGPNELVAEDGPGSWRILWKQFTEPLVVVLMVATVVSLAVWWFGESAEPLPYDAIVILAIVVLNAALGFVQEYRAERALEALEEMAAPEAKVRRGGRERRVPARELVPGDVVLVESGDRIAADLRLAEVANLKVDESALTGESVPVTKRADALDAVDTEPADRTDMAFMGTAATFGHATGIVVATGADTEMGEIAELLTGTGEETTPLQRDLKRVGRQLGFLVLGISVAVAAVGVLRTGALTGEVVLEMFLFGVALAVAAVPEGLPAIVTAVLAIGVRRMAARDAIVRRLPAVEALGSATVIASDKTGTLTRNEMTVRRILLGTDRIVEIEGEGFEPEGRFVEEEGEELDLDQEDDLRWLLGLAALANDARLVEEDGDWSVDGDPTEGALVVVARKAGIDESILREERPRTAEIPFSSERKRMTTVHEADGEPTAAVKGAPEVVLERCARIRDGGEVRELTDDDRRAIGERNEAFAERALRTLAVASRSLPEDVGTGAEPDPDEVERDLVWEGLVGMIDPPRPGVEESVQRARSAGVRTILVTGDHVLTGRAVAATIGVAEEGDEALAGPELENLSDADLEERVRTVDVYGRVRPEHKVRIVRALKAHDEVVAMTGDGVNDAPALKEADIGVAMGIAGTDVAREASEVVLADDDYSTIVEAIEEGRKIFDNIRKFVRYLLAANAGEVLTIFGAMALAGVLGLSGGEGQFFLPLLAVQILWVNLVTDGAPALALGLGPGDPLAMERPPRDPSEPIIDRPMWVTIGVLGTVIMLGTLFVLDAYLAGGLVEIVAGTGEEGARRARTMAFTTLVLFEMADVFNSQSATETVFRRQTLRNRWLLGAVALSLALHAGVVYWGPLQRGFETVALTGRDWLLAGAIASSVLVASEILKRTPLVRKE